MAIAKIEILGVRGFSNSQTLEMAEPNDTLGSGLTLLVGPNNAGKSTVIESLRAFSQNEPPSFTVGKRNDNNDSKICIKLTNTDGKVKELKTLEAGGSETEWINKDISSI